MNTQQCGARLVAALFCVVLTVGCATTREARQFEPSPLAKVGAEQLEPAAPRTVTDLLREAQDAFGEGNKAHEAGDGESALRYYTLMLELLIEADLDPAIFYDLRPELTKILTASAEQAHRFERHRLPDWGREGPAKGVLGELEFPFPFPERVLREIDEIQHVYPEGFQGGLDRHYRYAPFIRRELAAAGLPEDLLWLAMVESQFKTTATSPKGAGGMWQFMRGTALRFDLRIDYYVDERYHWQKATRAAIAYLKDLYEMFDGSWPLAVSAYNMGEQGLERAIAANGGRQGLEQAIASDGVQRDPFWTLIEAPPAAYHIRLETKKFYPRLLASIIVARNPERYGFELNRQPPESTVRIPVKGCYTLSALDRACGWPNGTLKRLNTELVRGVTPPSGTYELAVPADADTILLAALKDVPQVQHSELVASGGSHIVRPGETLSEIALRYRVSVNDLMKINRIRSARHLQVGKRLTIPGAGTAMGGAVTDSSGRPVYKVRRGDSLYTIAKRENVAIKDLQAWNNMGARTRIDAGDVLFVSPPSAKPAGAQTTHTVKAGEYPAKIARRYGVDLDNFLAWNKLTRKSKIIVGDKLVVYQPTGSGPPGQTAKTAADPESSATSKGGTNGGRAPQPDGTAEVVHRVAKGENPSVIADKYRVRTGDFLAWNGLSPSSVLRIGDEYVVYVAEGGDAEDKEVAKADEMAPGAASGELDGAEKTVHTVTKGQNPTTIARRYGVRVSDLFKWNGWDKAPVLQIGSKVIIYKKQ